MRDYRVLPADHPDVVALQGEPVDDAEERNAIVRTENGPAVEILAYDGGEPEDNTLLRDWSWVAPALKIAYETGLVEGASQTPDGSDDE